MKWIVSSINKHIKNLMIFVSPANKYILNKKTFDYKLIFAKKPNNIMDVAPPLVEVKRHVFYTATEQNRTKCSSFCWISPEPQVCRHSSSLLCMQASLF